MPGVSFEDNANAAVRQKADVGHAKHIANLKVRAGIERERLKSNQQLAQLFMGWVFVCLLAWYSSSSAGVLGGLGHTQGISGSITFNTQGQAQTQSFPTYLISGAAATEMVLVAASSKRSYLVLPLYSVGLYLHDSKVDELRREKSLSLMSSPAPINARDNTNPFLALTLTFARNTPTSDTVTELYSALQGARNKEYRVHIEVFKKALSDQIGVSGMTSGEVLEFLYIGPSRMGVSVRGQKPAFIDNADVRRRLLNYFAGEKAAGQELPATLRAAFLS